MDDHHIVQKWISLGDVVVLCASILGLAVSYGKLSADLAAVAREVQEIQARDITPGARAALGAMTARDEAQDEQIADIRIEMRETRREIMQSLDRLEQKLDGHAGK